MIKLTVCYEYFKGVSINGEDFAGEADDMGVADELEIETWQDVAEYIRDNGPVVPSSSSFHEGIWYTAYGSADYRTGNVTNRSFHLAAISRDDEYNVYHRVTGNIE